MIYGLLHKGSGIGNQLHRYIAIRTLSIDKGYEFGIAGKENFKGGSFMALDFGENVSFPSHVLMPAGELILETNLPIFREKTNYYNPEFNFIEDKTIIDGEFQDLRYFRHRINEVNEWLKVEPLEMPNDLCVINFRGGEYKLFPDLYLTHEYWQQAIEMMIKINPNMKFEVHTDDPEEAQKFFPDYKCLRDIGINWRAVRYAKYLIISNSSFAILPALLNGDVKKIIAPRYWARRNTKEWSTPQNYYPKFTYI